MSDYEDIGDIFYVPKVTCNALSKRKITMTDSEGIEWYRYDKSNWTGEVQKVTLVGVETVTIEGKVSEWTQEPSVTLYFEFPNGTIDTSDEWFISKRDAQLWLDKELAEFNEV